MIAVFEGDFRRWELLQKPNHATETVSAEAPPPQPAIIEAETGEDGKLHRPAPERRT